MQKVGVNPNAVTYGIYNRVSMGGNLRMQYLFLLFQALIDCNCPASVKSRWRAVVIVICTCLYLHKKVAPNDALDGMKMQLTRRNSYDEAIGDIFLQRRDSQSSSSSKGNGSPKLPYMKRSWSTSISKRKDFSKKKSRKHSSEEQEPEDKKETTTEEKVEKEGYTVKRGSTNRGSTNQQNKISQKSKPPNDFTDSYDRRYHTITSKPKGRFSSRLSIRRDNVPSSRSSTRMYAHLPSTQSGIIMCSITV